MDKMAPFKKSCYKGLHNMIFQLELHNNVVEWFSNDVHGNPSVKLEKSELDMYGLGFFGDEPQHTTWKNLMEVNQ